jgi:hypothetical protein
MTTESDNALTAGLAAADQTVPLQQGMAEIDVIVERERKHPFWLGRPR